MFDIIFMIERSNNMAWFKKFRKEVNESNETKEVKRTRQKVMSMSVNLIEDIKWMRMETINTVQHQKIQ